jgi:GntR family transcriptional regulator
MVEAVTMRRVARKTVAVQRPANEDAAPAGLKLPGYQQVYLTLRDWIYAGSFPAGSQLPTETELCGTFGVSRVTVRKAIDLLAGDGLVSRQQGRGTFVTERASNAPLTGEMEQLLKRLTALGGKTQISGVKSEIIAADDEMATDLGVERGEKVLCVSHLRHTRGEVTGSVRVYIPADLGLSFGRNDLKSGSMLVALEEKGIEIQAADQLIGATLATFDQAKILGVPVGTPLVRLRIVAFDSAYRPVLSMTALYRADYYQHHVHLVRKPGGKQSWV